MYTLSSKLKTFSLILMVLGFLGIGYGFYDAPKTIQDVEKILADEEAAHGGHHGSAAHADATHAPAHEAPVASAHETAAAEPELDSVHTDTIAVTGEAHADTTNKTFSEQTNPASMSEVKVEPGHGTAVNEVKSHAAEGHDAHADHQEHLEHVLHQLQNKPWAAVYVACIFFLLLTMGVLAFYGIQIVSQAGWSPVLFRVMQG